MIELIVPDMTCGHCASTVTRAIKAYDPEAKVVVSVADKKVTVETNEQSENIEACLFNAGYPAQRP